MVQRVSTGLHSLLVGKTGTGKSTHLGALAQADLRAGRGIALVDPHGDLADRVLLGVPSHRKNDLIPIDATKADTCPGLNPFRAVSPDRRALVASTLLATMRKLWPDFWGPRLEHVARHVFLALMEVRGATLLDAQRMLVDESHRRWVLRHVTDALVRQFWSLEFSGYDRRFAAEVTAPILNKLGALLASPVVRSIVTTRRRQLDVRVIMDRSRVLVAKLAKGQIGEDAALLLGGLVLGALQHATMSRADVVPAQLRPHQSLRSFGFRSGLAGEGLPRSFWSGLPTHTPTATGPPTIGRDRVRREGLAELRFRWSRIVSLASGEQIERVELHVEARVLVVTIAGRDRRLRFGSTPRAGLASYLVSRRIHGANDGWTSEIDILAEAPGWDPSTAPASVGKRISEFRDTSNLAAAVIESPRGCTIPPWRIGPDPHRITVADPEAFERLLAQRAHLRRAHETLQAAPTIDERAVLHQIEQELGSGMLSAPSEKLLAELLLSPDGFVRAKAARLDATRLRRAGALALAGERGRFAHVYFTTAGTSDPEQAAAALNELGAVEYRRGQIVEARTHFLAELALLDSVEAPARSRGRARCLSCLALTAFRDADAASDRWAQEAIAAADAAGDDAERCIARAVELRILANRGQAADAAERLGRLALLVPVTDPAAALLIRRLYAESLYICGEAPLADEVAMAVFLDAKKLGSARDLDATVRLLRLHGRKEVLAEVPPECLPANRDRLDDYGMIGSNIGRRDPVTR